MKRFPQYYWLISIVVHLLMAPTLSYGKEESSDPDPSAVNAVTTSGDTTATSSESSNEPETPPPRKFYAAVGSGKTLPAKVLRVRLPYQNLYGKEGFDENGNKESLGFEINIDALALAAEYGLTDKISLAVVAPFVVNSEAGLNANTIRLNSRKFHREFGRYKDAVKSLMQSQNLCTTDSDCEAKIYSSNYAIPANQEVTTTTGEKVLASSHEPVARQIDSLLFRSITPKDGETGLGDVTVGGLYNFYSANNLSLSTGLGIRLPTGKFKNVPSGQRAIGGGVTDLGIRFNVDYHFANWGVVALQHQIEQMIIKGESIKDSSIYNDRTNTGDPTDPLAIAIGGDGFDNNQEFERWGLGHDGFLRFNFALTPLADTLQPMGIGLSYRWYEGRETRYDGQAFDGNGWRYDEITRLRFAGFAMSWDGLGMNPLVPLSFKYEYETPISGSLATVAPTTNRIQFIGYYKF